MGEERNQRRREKKRLLKLLDDTFNERPCGGCTACCTVMGIEELNKPGYEPCKHICEMGCNIYKTKPKSCTDFQCMWRVGIGTLEQRPDMCGLVIDTSRPGDQFHPAFIARELWPGAFEENDEMLQEVASKMMLFLVKGEIPMRVMGPEPRIQASMVMLEDMFQELRRNVRDNREEKTRVRADEASTQPELLRDGSTEPEA